MKRSIFTLALFFVLFASKAQDYRQLINRIDDKLDEVFDKHNAPGLNLTFVFPNGEARTFAKGMADIEKGISMSADHKMLGGSTGKVFYSVVIMQLIDEGLLDLDTPVNQYLKGYKDFARVPNAEKLTLRNLMRHESGIPRYVFKESFQVEVIKDVDRVWKPEELLSYVYDDEPMFEVTSDFAYSDTNYIVAAMVVEAVTGNTLFEEVEERVLQKANLKQVLNQNTRSYDMLAQGYNAEDDPFFPGKALNEQGNSRYNWQFEWAGGGLVITSHDLAVLGKKIYEGEMFSASSLKEYLNGRSAGRMGGTWGLGVHIRDTPNGKMLGHSGFMPGYITNMMYFEDYGLSVCYQVNTSDPQKRAIMRDLPSVINVAIEGLKD